MCFLHIFFLNSQDFLGPIGINRLTTLEVVSQTVAKMFISNPLIQILPINTHVFRFTGLGELSICHGYFDPLVPVVPKLPDYSNDISLTKEIFRKCSKEKFWSKSNPQFSFKYFEKFLINSKVIFKRTQVPDDFCQDLPE